MERDSRWKLAERLVSTPGFAKSPRLSTLLLHIVKQTVDGREQELNEQLIGERAFGRPVGYDSRDDNIVRAHASRLRQKLEAYYREEGKDDPVRIVIPRGSYVPAFKRIDTAPSFPPEDTLPANTDPEPEPQSAVSVPAQRFHHPLFWAAGACLCIALGVAIAIFTRQTWDTIHKPHEDATDRLWSDLFNKNRDSLIVPADSGLIILKSLAGHSISAIDYASGRYLSNVACQAPCNSQLLETLASHRYTSLADLQFAVDLTHVPQAMTTHPQIRYARDIQLEDLKNSNLVLIGSLESDPWLQFFQGQMNFILHDDRNTGPLRIENKRPRPGEQSSYFYDRNDPTHHGYALATFLPNLSGTGDVLIVQGFTLADTQAAAEFVTSRRDFDALFSPIIAKRHELPHFEVLLQTVDVNGFGARPSVVTFRTY